MEPEIVIASGFEYKVPEEIIVVPEKGIVNLHPSFLPYNRGAHPYIWPIVEDTPAGVSILPTWRGTARSTSWMWISEKETSSGLLLLPFVAR
ncbi:MAG: formyltransferase family protein [Candidatus Nanohalobium sp.]